MHARTDIHLDRVAQAGAGAVHLQHGHLARRHVTSGQRGPDDRLLRRPVRRLGSQTRSTVELPLLIMDAYLLLQGCMHCKAARGAVQ